MDIDSRSWEHPADRAALSALKQLPGFDQVVKQVIGLTSEKSLRLLQMASAVRAGERQFPRVYRLLQDACYVLDCQEKPEIYVAQSPIFNAGAFGVDNAFITVNSATVNALSDPELLAVIAHELAHIMSGHVLYKTLLFLLVQISTSAIRIPLGQLAIMAIIGALQEWDRKSELSADRASLLVVQNEAEVYGLLMKMAGGTEGDLVLEEFLVQAAEYEAGGTVLDSVHKILNQMKVSHPFPVLRLKELKVWHDSGEYQKILDGEYRKRDEKTDPKSDFAEAFASYRESLANTKDPLGETINKIGTFFENAGKAAGVQAEELFKSVFGNNPFKQPDRDSGKEPDTTNEEEKDS